jgi:Protein of unknown function (DUF4239)
VPNIARFLSGLPTTLAVIIALCGGGALAALGLLAAHQLLPHAVRSEHNAVSGFVLSIVGAIYSVLLAFIAVAVWQDFGQAEHLVQTEANLVGDLYRDTVAFPEPTASELRRNLFVYAESVVQDEWPALAAGHADEAAGWQLLDRFHSEVVNLRTPEQGVARMQADAVQTLAANSLVQPYRRCGNPHAVHLPVRGTQLFDAPVNGIASGRTHWAGAGFDRSTQ